MTILLYTGAVAMRAMHDRWLFWAVFFKDKSITKIALPSVEPPRAMRATPTRWGGYNTTVDFGNGHVLNRATDGRNFVARYNPAGVCTLAVGVCSTVNDAIDVDAAGNMGIIGRLQYGVGSVELGSIYLANTFGWFVAWLSPTGTFTNAMGHMPRQLAAFWGRLGQ